MKVPFVDLKTQYTNVKTELDKSLESVIDDATFVGGSNNKYTQDFENKFAEYIGVKHCISCGNGTDALEIAIKAAGIGTGDEVIVPALTWISTSEAVGNCGATPVFVDVDPTTYTIDTKRIERAVSPKTKAIIPVHLYGLPADMDEIVKIAQKHNLLIIEDCAQAHGAKYKNHKVGTLGKVATFSFFPTKNLGAWGDAGCIVTNDDQIMLLARKIANHGMIKRHEHEFEGRNSRMDAIQSAILSVKLKYLDNWNNRRISLAKFYDKNLPAQIIRPLCKEGSSHVYHLYVIQVEDRDNLKEKLKEAGIETAVHYPTALPFLKTYSHLGHQESDFPVAGNLTKKILSLPMFPELTEEQLMFVVKNISDII
jgi:dTDP-4-amino-4,6-dideoxygalactose transaminase